MAEIDANLTIEDLPLTEEELAFFDLVFGLNVSEAEEAALRQLWIVESETPSATRVNAAE